VALRPSLWLLWTALTRLVGFAFKPWALVDPTAIVGLILDLIAISHDVEGVLYEESGDV
jgi:hypothetical protein